MIARLQLRSDFASKLSITLIGAGMWLSASLTRIDAASRAIAAVVQ